MSSSLRRNIFLSIFIIILVLLAAACGKSLPAPTATQPQLSLTLTPTATPMPPTSTPTPIPLAALVNGEAIPLADYQAELARYQSTLKNETATPSAGTNLATDANQIVLDDLIDQALLSQAAAKEGYQVDDAALQARLGQLSEQAGGAQALSAWEAAQGYTDESFRLALKNAMAAAWMRDRIAAGVPEAVEQVHARQILLYNEAEANQILSQIEAGADFATLAKAYDPVAGGDLGWFPKGYLIEPALEQAAFSLQPGEHSNVIHTRLGYHILEVIERDPQHPLEPDARQALQTQAVRSWLAQRRSQSDIKIFIQ
jgi:peptidyl-prolyl cis-trans isomerase C